MLWVSPRMNFKNHFLDTRVFSRVITLRVILPFIVTTQVLVFLGLLKPDVNVCDAKLGTKFSRLRTDPMNQLHLCLWLARVITSSCYTKVIWNFEVMIQFLQYFVNSFFCCTVIPSKKSKTIAFYILSTSAINNEI